MRKCPGKSIIVFLVAVFAVVVAVTLTGCPHPDAPGNDGVPSSASPINMISLNGTTVRSAIGSNGGPFSAASTVPVTVSAFAISDKEITYEQWYEVYHWATSTERGNKVYSFANKGRSGNSGVDGAVPQFTTNQPVTSVSWRDAVVWCNAASEKAGLNPVYYQEGTTDFADASKVIRVAETVTAAAAGSGKADKAAVNPNANGYRLPTEAEWEFAARGGNPDDVTNWTYECSGSDQYSVDSYVVYTGTGTAAVGSKKANSKNIYDMSGNVWEWCFDTDASWNCILRGGSYRASSTAFCKVDIRTRNKPYYQISNVGFRVAKNIADGNSGSGSGSGTGGSGSDDNFTPVALNVDMVTFAGATVSGNIGNAAFKEASSTPVTVAAFDIAETELEYSKWYEVYQWAINSDRGAKKYKFDGVGKEGDNGISGSAPFAGRHQPVTNVTWRHAVVWCNAASEREGLTPVYWLEGTTSFTDSARVLREAESKTAAAAGSGKAEHAVINPNANGYRLPTEAEWEFAFRGGNPESALWYSAYAGTNNKEYLNVYAVYNTEGTADVKSKAATVAGLYDMSGNVYEFCWNLTDNKSVYRGGAYNSIYENCTASARGSVACTQCSKQCGFRLARQASGTGTGTGSGAGSGSSSPVALGVTMIALNGSGNVESFCIAETELTYRKWYDVFTWAVSQERGYNGYIFASCGIEGSTLNTAGKAPSTGSLKPVTNMNWRDAVVWCNAASEREGLTPVYWLEGTTDFTDTSKVLRYAENDTVASGAGKAEKAVVNPAANGYRLPTSEEWEFAARGANPAADAWYLEYAGSDTAADVAVYNQEDVAAVTTKAANAKGLYDMSGNVCEWCFDDADDESKVVRGGAFDYGDDYIDRLSVSVCESSLIVEYYEDIGFRIVKKGN